MSSIRLQFVKQSIHAIKDRLFSGYNFCFDVVKFFPEYIPGIIKYPFWQMTCQNSKECVLFILPKMS